MPQVIRALVVCSIGWMVLLHTSTTGYAQFSGGSSSRDFAPSYQSQPSLPPPTYAPDPNQSFAPAPGLAPAPQPGEVLPGVPAPFDNVLGAPGQVDPLAPPQLFNAFEQPRERIADLIINGFPARTGRIQIGGAVNSDAGLTGQLTIDERNFNIWRFPRSLDDLLSGTAFKGRGQTLRVEAAPGTDFQRYTVNFVNPNIFNTPISTSISGFLFDRRFEDFDEERLGGRLSFGYRITPDLSVNLAFGGQNVEVSTGVANPPPELEEVLGDNEFYSGEISLTHDTRNRPINPDRGHFLQFSFEEAFGDFDYGRFEVEYRQFWLLAERADRSGKQILSYTTRLGISGEETPLFENFFAGGFATLRGFDFRGANPVDVASSVETGGRFQWLNTVEYSFPITADDAFRGLFFVDFGTVEDDVEIVSDNFRIAPGFGLRIAIPALGPAPLAFDFGFPVASADTDDERLFSFSVAR